jgi:hypothetical protein
MECSDFREQISLYIDGMLDMEQEEEFKQHINICADCRCELDEMMELVRLCNSIPEEDLPDNFKQELHIKLMAEKEKQKKSKWVRAIRSKSIRFGSAIAAVVMLVFAMRGVFIHNMPLKGTQNSDISLQYNTESAGEAKNSLLRESDPQVDLYGERDDLNQYNGQSQESHSDIAAAAPELTKVIQKSFSEEAAITLTSDANQEEAPSIRANGSQERYSNKEGTRGSTAPEQIVEGGLDDAFLSQMSEDGGAAVTVQPDWEDVGKEDYAYKFCNVSEITIKASNPRTEFERIKLYLVARGAEILDSIDDIGEIPLDGITEKTKIQQSRASGGVVMVARIPVSLYPQISSAMRSSFTPSVITISPVYTVDMSQRAIELENSLLSIDIQLKNALKDKENVTSDALNPIKELKAKASKRLQWINQGAGNVFVVISIVRN